MNRRPTDSAQTLLRDLLNGNAEAFHARFEDEGFMQRLIAEERPEDWYRFKARTYDGAYLVKVETHYEVYQQDRGQKFCHTQHNTLFEAAGHFFNLNR